MYSEGNLVYLLTILEAVEKVKVYSEEFDNADDFLWSNQQLNYNATVNLLIAIGEESKKIDPKLKDEFPAVKWNEITGMRDKLAHDYRGIDPNIVWNVARKELDDLKSTIIQMLNRVEYDPAALSDALNTKYYSHLDYLKPSKQDGQNE